MKVKFIDIFLDETKRGCKIQTNEYSLTGKYPIIDQGHEQIAGYTDLEDGLFSDVPVIVFGDHTRIVKYIETPFFLGADGVKVLKSKLCNTDCKYLFYWLSNAKIPNTGYNRHYKWLKELKINLPALAEQHHIAAVLDKVSDLINLRKKQLAKLDELVKARFVEMFGNPVNNSLNMPLLSLKQLGNFGRGVSKYRPRNAPELLGGKYPLIQTGEVANAGLYISSYENTYSELGLQQSKMWKKGTLCITIAANIAKTAILSFDACFPDSVVGFNSNSETNNIFIHYWFDFFQQILEAQAPESAQKNINLRILSELKVIVPERNLQNKFVKFVEMVDKQKTTIKQSLEKLETLKKSLMQEYFR